MPDIDIDITDRNAALEGLQFVPAVMIQNDGRVKHSSSIYFQDIPTDPLDGMAVWDHKDAEQRGYFKIDCISSKQYVGVRDEQHLDQLLNTPPPWHLLRDPKVVGQLHQIHDHIDVLEQFEPQTIDELAVCIAIIRPGKRYLRSRPYFEIQREIWLPTGSKSEFTRAHAIAYAASLVVQLNLLVEQQKV